MIALVILFVLHIVVPYVYYLYMKRIAEKRPWNIVLNHNYEPTVTVILPTYNESSVIEKKLRNLSKLDYSKEKLDVILVDSASTDKTVDIAKTYIKENEFPFKILMLEEKDRGGKSRALNFALQHTSSEIIATSDTDSYWDPSVLREVLPYMSSPQVGAITGREILTNLNQNVYTKAEGSYRKMYNAIRVGESKLHSTLIFQGELSAYKRKVFEKFEEEGADDNGTLVNIIAKGYRCIFVPSAVFHDVAPYTLKGRITLKVRRAQHLIYALTKATSLKLKGLFPVPKLMIFMAFYLHIINAILSIIFLATLLLFLLLVFPASLLVLPLLFVPKKLRILLVSYVTSNIALLLALLRCMRGDKQKVWKKVTEMRDLHDVSN